MKPMHGILCVYNVKYQRPLFFGKYRMETSGKLLQVSCRNIVSKLVAKFYHVSVLLSQRKLFTFLKVIE